MSEAVSIPEGFREPQQFTIPRESDRDLTFAGWMIGKATQPTRNYGVFDDHGHQVDAGIDVRIYSTEGGRIVTHSYRWSEYARGREGDTVFGGYTGERHRLGTHAAAWHADAESALAWLRGDAGGKLGESSKAAWVEACQQWPGLAEHETEVVDAVAARATDPVHEQQGASTAEKI